MIIIPKATVNEQGTLLSVSKHGHLVIDTGTGIEVEINTFQFPPKPNNKGWNEEYFINHKIVPAYETE